MKCKKCGGKIVDGCCISCGYMINGSAIRNIQEKPEELDSEIEKMITNENKILIFLLGSSYISLKGYVFIGVAISLFNSLIILTFLLINLWIGFLFFIFSKVFMMKSAKDIIVLTNRRKKDLIKNNYIYFIIHNLINIVIIMLIFVVVASKNLYT